MNLQEQIWLGYAVKAQYVTYAIVAVVLIVLLAQLVIKDKYRVVFTLTGLITTFGLIIARFFIQKAQIEQVPEMTKNIASLLASHPQLKNELITWETYNQLFATIGHLIAFAVFIIAIAIIGVDATNSEEQEQKWENLANVGAIMLVVFIITIPISISLQTQEAPQVYILKNK